MPVSEPVSGSPLQCVSGREVPAEDLVGRSAEGDWEVEEPVEDPGSTCRWEMWAGGSGLPLVHERGKASTTSGRGRRPE